MDEEQLREKHEEEDKESQNADLDLLWSHFEESQNVPYEMRELSTLEPPLQYSIAQSSGARSKDVSLDQGSYFPPTYPSETLSPPPAVWPQQDIHTPENPSHSSLQGDLNFCFNYSPCYSTYDDFKEPSLPDLATIIEDNRTPLVKCGTNHHIEKKQDIDQQEASPLLRPQIAEQTSHEEWNNWRIHQLPTQSNRSHTFYRTPNMKPTVSSMYGMPAVSSNPIHCVIVKTSTGLKAEPLPGQYVSPSPYLPSNQTQSSTVVHTRTSLRGGDHASPSPCRFQPYDLGVAQVLPRRRCEVQRTFERRRMEGVSAPEPLIAAASVGRMPCEANVAGSSPTALPLVSPAPVTPASLPVPVAPSPATSCDTPADPRHRTGLVPCTCKDHETFPILRTIISKTTTITKFSSSTIVARIGTNSNRRRARDSTKPENRYLESFVRAYDAEEDISSSDRETISQLKRKLSKAKRVKKGNVRKELKKKAGSLRDSSSSSSGGSGVFCPHWRGPCTSRSRSTSELFLQSKPCFKVIPWVSKCRECLRSPAQKSMDSPDIFCRFVAFRRLYYDKDGLLVVAGFPDPYKTVEEEDKRLWLSSSERTGELGIEMSCFLLRAIGDQFCNLLEQENSAKLIHQNTNKTVAWKRVIPGVREMCDVCETTMFNYHWTCSKCGFVVCLDCYKWRVNRINNPSSAANSSSVSSCERDLFGWLKCTSGGVHHVGKLLLTQILTGGALATVAARFHYARDIWSLPACHCGSVTAASPQDIAAAKKLLHQALQNSQSIKKGDLKEENVSTNLMWPMNSEDDKASSSVMNKSNVPVKTSPDETDVSSVGEYVTTFGELLVQPTPEGGDKQSKEIHNKNESDDDMEEVIASVVGEQKDENSNSKLFRLSDLVTRYERSPVRMTLTESRVLYPDVPHAWLCDGKLLHLTDSTHPGNYRLFQDKWKLGQPVLVSDLPLKKNLWTPESFSREFGDTLVDLINCKSGYDVPGQPASRFWDGFDLAEQRLRDEQGVPIVLKLKDWPPGEDFAEILPDRFNDFVRVLPLSEYTTRDGRLNLAARLPECFVHPYLGPRMYAAYGDAGGTINLHLDVSDSVNVMVHASAPIDAPGLPREAASAADEAGLDILSRKRAQVKPPAAVWHIYHAKDAGKIRDFLVKLELERKTIQRRPDYDAIHDQTWYLDATLRERLYQEYGVEGYAILQCPGDAVFVPAGAPHQVRNLLDSIKVAEEFVSPENLSWCLELAQQFRRQSRYHANKEDKLQIKNIVYHAVKDSLCCLEEALAAATAADK